MTVADQTTVADRMSKLSERAKTAEEHAAAARTQAKADLERSANEARAKAQAQADRLHDTANATEARISASWSDLQTTWGEHLAKVRQNIDDKKAEIDAKQALRRADAAEEDALFAIDYAYGTIEEAEYAVLDAILARMDADDLAES
jgi:hypothetical protein